MSPLKRQNSLSAQLAAILEKEIFGGRFPMNAPLPSTRELARKFTVSQRVVISALDLLQKKDLIFRSERRAVYVKARAAAANAHEILFFAFSRHSELQTIPLAFNGITTDPRNNGKYDFFTRIVSSGDVYTPGRLDRELARLENLGFVDCAVIYTAGFSGHDIEKCLRLPYPVIFAGELPPGVRSGKSFTHLRPDQTALFRTAYEYAAARKYEKTVLAYLDSRSDRKTLLAAEKLARAFPFDFELEGFAGNDDSAIAEFDAYASELALTRGRKTLLMTVYLRSGKFDSGLLTKDSKYLSALSIDAVLPCGIMRIGRDFPTVQAELLRMIANVTERRNLCEHKTVNTALSVEAGNGK